MPWLRPGVHLLCEPTTGLDPIGVYNIVSLMNRLQEAGKTTLIGDHDLPTAFATSHTFLPDP